MELFLPEGMGSWDDEMGIGCIMIDDVAARQPVSAAVER